jgi:hypothetical protein
MKLAVMQPYFFPYLGYFQLINAVDIFVVYDDVAFIKGGWTNRNFLLMGCSSVRFTVPLHKASQNRSICATRISGQRWQQDFLKTLHQAYAKAPQFEPIYALTERVVQREYPNLAELALESLVAVAGYLGIPTEIRPTSRTYDNALLKGQERILDICRQEKADTYINLPGGRHLYDPTAFLASGVDLRFLQPEEIRYPQFRCEFVPQLSMLDVLMFNERESAQGLLRACKTVN